MKELKIQELDKYIEAALIATYGEKERHNIEKPYTYSPERSFYEKGFMQAKALYEAQINSLLEELNEWQERMKAMASKLDKALEEK